MDRSSFCRWFEESTLWWFVVLLWEYDTSCGIDDTVGMRSTTIDRGAAVLAALFAVGVLLLGIDSSEPAPLRSLLAASAGGLALVFRRERAVVVLLAVAAARLFVTWDTGDDFALMPATVLALYTVARDGKRWPRLVIAALIGSAIALATAALGDEAILDEFAGEAAQNLLPVAIAEAMRTRADRVKDVVEAEAEARVQAERLRIARDLHDVVAHGLSTIAIQSGVAARLIDSDVAQAKEALEAINATGKSSLDELRGLLRVLRSTDGPELRPTPSDPDDIGGILRTASGAGLVLTHDVTGSFPADVADAAVVAVHRIVQEALTNVTRHAGPVATRVCLVHGPAGVDVEIENDPPAGERQPVPSTGVGIVGMQERADSLGGVLDAGATPSGGFCVSARIPYGTRAPG